MYATLTMLWLALTDPPAGKAPPRRRPAFRRPILEALEDRTVPSSVTAATVTDLIADINAANLAGGSNTIALVAGNTFTLTAVQNTTDGGNGLPVIAANDNLTIQGNGDTIARDTAAPAFRLFDVASGASLTLANVTLQGGNGYAGGAILNQGALDLKGVTVQNNTAQNNTFGGGGGGGIYSSGSLTLEAGTLIRGNVAHGNVSFDWGGGRGTPVAATGGGVCVAGGTATLTNVTLSSNSAVGVSAGWNPVAGYEWPAGPAFGGGLYAAGGTVTLRNVTMTKNSAQGGQGLKGGPLGLGGDSAGVGGGLYIDSAAIVYLDAFTLKNTKGNHPDNIYGTYTLIT